MTLAEAKLGDLLDLYNGKKPNLSADGQYPVFGSNGIIGRSKQQNHPPSVILGRVGAYCGSVKFSDGPFWASDNTIVTRPKSGQSLRYWYYKLQTIPLRGYAGGAAQPLITHSIMKPISTGYHPNLPTQNRIASILSAYDELIENNRRRIALLEQAARLLYREWFVHFRFPGHETATFVHGLPKGWERKKVSDFGEVVTGKTPSKKNKANFGGHVPFIKTPDMHGKTFVSHTDETLSEQGAKTQAKKTLPPRSILVSCIGTVGVVTMNATKAQTNQQINSVVPSQEHSPYVVFFAMKDLRPKLEGLGGGVTMANVSKGKFESIPVVVPSSSMQQGFEEAVEPMFAQILKLSEVNTRLVKARDLLLPRLMDGRISVAV